MVFAFCRTVMLKTLNPVVAGSNTIGQDTSDSASLLLALSQVFCPRISLQHKKLREAISGVIDSNAPEFENSF